jgi:flagellin
MSVINTNISALSAQINLDRTSQMLQSSVEKLSSGLRINHAADDAAGLAISTSLTSAVNGTEQGIRNAQSGISMIQTADGALGQVQSILQRMRELAVEASNGDLNSTDRNAIQQEINQLGGTGGAIDSIAQNTKYNGLSLLSGTLSTSLSSGNITAATTVAGLTVTNLNISGAQQNTTYSLSVCASNDTATMTATTSAGLTLASQTISYRSMVANDSQVFSFNQLGVSFAVQSTGTTGTNFTVGDIATDLNGGTASFSTTQGSNSVTLQMGPDNSSADQVKVSFGAMGAVTLGVNSIDVSSATSAQSAIQTIDNAIDKVSTQRGSLGAAQNSLQYNVQALQIGDENLTAANSRILDLDVSAETVNFTKEQILSQAGTSVLAQANSLPQSVLKLLG